MNRIISIVFALMLLCVPQLAAAYTIAPGDTLRVEVLEDDSLSREVLVLPDGTANFPGAGTLRVSGLTPASVQSMITSKIAPQFANPPSVYVSVAGLARVDPDKLKAANAKNIYIMGEVAKPGLVEAEPGVTILQAIAQAGGFTRFAATKRIELHRMDPQTHTEQVYYFNYRDSTRKSISGATPLTKGDVIVVPERHLFE